MRKKSKKKQIVAMTLALSVLSSSVGMCGASAAEALSDTDGSGLQVTVVPWLTIPQNPRPRPPRARAPAQKEESPCREGPACRFHRRQHRPDHRRRGRRRQRHLFRRLKPTIERPEQSETVETLPGTAEDNKDHIKGEDKDDTEDKGDSGEEIPRHRRYGHRRHGGKGRGRFRL